MRLLPLITATLALTLTACATPQMTDSPDGKPATPPKSKAAKQAKIGDTITLKGNDPGSKMAVTVLRFAAVARGKDEFNQPEKGQRFVAVQITLRNVGTVAYDDSPGNGAKVVDTEDQQYDEAMSEVALGPAIGSAVKLGPGSARKGYLVFSVPKKAAIAKFQFTLDSGFASQSAEWLLK